jgi:hypothetical protein
MIVNLFITCYSSHDLLQDTIDYYLSKIPGVKITVYFHSDEILLDDDSEFVAINCESIISNLNIQRMVNKNKNINKQWVLIVNVDQLVDINSTNLFNEYKHGVTELKFNNIKTIGYFKNIFNLPKRVSLKRYNVNIQELQEPDLEPETVIKPALEPELEPETVVETVLELEE